MNVNISAVTLVIVSCILSWTVGLPFRRNRKAMNLRFAIAGILVAPLLGVICFYGYTLAFQYFGIFLQGETGWKPLLLQMFAIPVFWIVMVVSASLQKNEKNV